MSVLVFCVRVAGLAIDSLGAIVMEVIALMVVESSFARTGEQRRVTERGLPAWWW